MKKDTYTFVYLLIISTVILTFLLVVDISVTNNIISGFVSADNEFTDIVTIGDGNVTPEIKTEEISEDITREQALTAIENAEIEITEMVDEGFNTVYVNDLLLEANKALKRADYAELLKTENHTNELVNEAKEALEGMDWKGFKYYDVIVYTNQISGIKDHAYEISDFLVALELKLQNYKEEGIEVEESERLLESANLAFKEERYDAAEKLLEETNYNLDFNKAEFTSFKAFTKASKTFIQDNWWKLIILTILLSIFIWWGYKRYVIIKAKDKLKQYKAEKKSITNLIKKAQTERFTEGSIPAATYKVRIDKYRERMSKIKRTIPVLRAIIRGKYRK